MNKIRNLRHKSPTPTPPTDDSMPPGEDHVRGAGGGLFNKIKRYSNVSHKLMRRANTSHSHSISMPRKHSPHRSTCGSYDMTGDSSRDLRPEIGAPVLITTTALDIDKITSIMENPSLPVSVIPVSSSESETEVFADASASLQDFGQIKFSFFENGAVPGNHFNVSTSTEEGDYEIVPNRQQQQQPAFNVSMPEERLETVSPPLRKNKISKSVGNLISPRKLSAEDSVRHPVSSVDLPVLCSADSGEYDSSGYYNEPAPDYEDCDKETSNATTTTTTAGQKVTTAWNANMVSSPITSPPEPDEFKRSLSAIILQSANGYEEEEEVGSPPARKDRERSVLFQDEVDTRILEMDEDRISHKSFSSVSCLSDDFDLKSASFEDLKERRQVFLSIEEFNALTKEIKDNEEEFNNSITVIDQEYCDHRSNLRPNQRRVTLMRNKPTSKIQLNLTDKKEKITSAWSGFKHWIGEERGKIKEVVQRHSALQRVGAGTHKSPGKEGGEEAVSPRDKSGGGRRSLATTEENEEGVEEATADDLDNAQAVDCNVQQEQRRDSRRRSEERDLFHTVLRQKSKTNSTASGAGGAAAAAASAEVIVTCAAIYLGYEMRRRERRRRLFCIV